MEIIRVNKTWQQALVFDIRRQTFIEYQHIPQEHEFDEIYGNLYHYILVIDDKKGIATARVNISNPSLGKIERVAVIPSHQNKGIGSLLIKACEEWFLELKINKCVITSQTKAVAFYEKNGYVADYQKELKSSIPITYLEKYLRKKEVI